MVVLTSCTALPIPEKYWKLIRNTAFCQLTARIGQFKTMYTIENPMSPCFVELINCYSQAVNYLAGINGSDPLYGSNSGRDMGILIYGDLFEKLLSYNLAVMNGQGINLKDKNNQKDIVGSLMVHPLNWLSVGGSFVKGKGCAVAASSVNPDIAIGDSYTRNRWSAGATIQTKPVSLRTEYLAGKDGHVKSDGYYATASVHVLPKFDVIASYDYFNKDKAQITDKQSNYVAGVQYGGSIPNAACRHNTPTAIPPQRRKLQPAAGTIAGTFLIYGKRSGILFVHL